MKQPIVLRIYKADELQGVKQFLEDQIVIGRPGEVSVGLEGETVSFIHAAIEKRDNFYYVCDLGSESGTLKNGEAVLDSRIESGDLLQIGEYRIEFFLGVPKPKAPPRNSSAKSATNENGSTPSKEDHPQADLRVVSRSVSHVNENIELSSKKNGTDQSQEEVVVDGVSVRSARSAKRTPKDKKKSGKTFAPSSHFKRTEDFIKPSKGTVIEVLLAWRERIIGTYHFSGKKTITLGTHPDCDIVTPVHASQVRRIPILNVDAGVTIHLTPEMKVDLSQGRMSLSTPQLLESKRLLADGPVRRLLLEQGELAKIDLGEGLALIVRYVSETPKPALAPIFDLTSSELTGVVLSIGLVFLLWLYMFLYSPKKIAEETPDTEPVRTAVILLPKPTPKPIPVMPSERAQEKTEIPVEHPKPLPQQVQTSAPVQPQKVETAKKPKAQANLAEKAKEGRASKAAPNQNRNAPRRVTSPKKGGSIKTAKQEGSQMRSPKKKDVTKSGIFNTFGGGGVASDLSESTSGSGDLAGLAEHATGRSGFSKSRPGDGLGSDLKDTGRGDSGESLNGVANAIKTSGRGGGNKSYGHGGLGDRKGVKIVTGGAEEVFSGSIDRDAIRRVIVQNLRVIRSCYERELNRHPDLFGKLILSWEIGEQGRVLSTKVRKNELGNNQVAECIMSRLKTWRFPEPPSNQVVEVEAYPFVFSN